MNISTIPILLIVLFSLSVKASDPVEDSLMHLVRNAPNDTTRLFHLDDLIWHRLYFDMDKAYSDAHSAIELSEKTGHLPSIARANHTLGTVYLQISLYDSALIYFFRGLESFEKAGMSNKKAVAYNGIANAYLYQGYYESALKYYLDAVKNTDPENKANLALITANIGAVYQNLDNPRESIRFAEKSLNLSYEIGDSLGIAACLNNLGNSYSYLNDTKKAENYFLNSLGINLRHNQILRAAENYNNLGILEKNLGNANKAEEYFLKSIELNRQLNNPEGIGGSLANLAGVYQRRGDTKKAKELLQDAEYMLKGHYSRERMMGILGPLHEIFATENNYPEAYNYLLKYLQLKDTIFGTESSRQIAEMQIKYDIEKQEQEIELLNKDNQLQSIIISRQNLLRNGLLSGIGVLVAFGLMITRGYRQKKRANLEISRQKEIIESRNRDITDSINYAKRIQSSILAPVAKIKSSFPEFFVFYQPKDIVSGDFYFFISANDHYYLAVADCTGHGVPGALISMVCSNALEKSIKEKNLISPGEILNETRDQVIEAFKKTNEELKDGMDISLCVLNHSKTKLQWAGANNPLWIIDNQSLTEIKGDKQPIGISSSMRTFTTHDIAVSTTATYIMSSDGFADQFGGTTGKKLKTKNFKELLTTLPPHELPRYDEFLHKWFVDWKGELEQVDDICVMGFRTV